MPEHGAEEALLQVVVGVTLFAALLITLANFLVDVVYGLIDPRVTFGS